MSPKDVHILVPESYEYVNLHGKRNFADMMRLGILKWKDPELSSGHNVITSVLKRGREGDVMIKAEERGRAGDSKMLPSWI